MFITIDLKHTLKAFALVILIVSAILLTVLLTNDDTVQTFAGVSEYTLVIDAGHGGVDGGAVSASGVKESDINLEIALRTNEIAGLFGINTVMTRDTDTDNSENQPYSEHNNLVRRAEIANSTPNAVLMSIHQNTFPTDKVKGAEVMFADTQSSNVLGLITQTNLVEQADPENRRVARPAPSSLLLTSSVDCPAILVECGFMSNPDEAQKLSNEAYQLKIATVLLGSFIQFSDNMTI